MIPPEPEHVTVAAADRRFLAGTLFRPAGPATAALLVSPATGFRRGFYRAFATHAAMNGLLVLTYDNRGIGDSRQVGSLSRDEARLQDWGELDAPAALEWLTQEAGEAPLALLGHSAGGQLMGLMHNVGRLKAIATVASSSGHLPNLSPELRWKAWIMMRLYMPAAAAMLGYVPAKRLGWGEDLPKQVALQWARWCRSPGYALNGLKQEVKADFHHAVTSPLLHWSASDDPIATERNSEDLLRLYPNAQIERRRVAVGPGASYAAIGHAGFFKPDLQQEWRYVLDWIGSSVRLVRSH